MDEPHIESDAIDAFVEGLDPHKNILPSRINLHPEKVEQGLAKPVLALIELVRQLLERQTIRRMDAGSLSDEEIERLEITLMKLEQRMEELKEHFGIDDLNMDLGPLGRLLD
jgi:hypothetical protein